MVLLGIALVASTAAAGKTGKAVSSKKSTASEESDDTEEEKVEKKEEPKSAKQINLGGIFGSKKGNKAKGKTVVKQKVPGLPKTTIPPGPTVDKRVEFVKPIGQSLPENGGTGGWPNEVPNKGKGKGKKKGNRQG